MNLEMQVIDYHLIVTDGCNINSVESCISGDDELKRLDDSARDEKSLRDRGFLFYRNIMFLRQNYVEGIHLNLKCPKCEKIYEISRDDLSILEKYYKELDY